MVSIRLAVPAPGTYRYAVHCCGYKADMDVLPDHAVALFADEAMARRYGDWMWPSTFEVVDLLAPKEGAS
jgi:hypothetical protein